MGVNGDWVYDWALDVPLRPKVAVSSALEFIWLESRWGCWNGFSLSSFFLEQLFPFERLLFRFPLLLLLWLPTEETLVLELFRFLPRLRAFFVELGTVSSVYCLIAIVSMSPNPVPEGSSVGVI